MFKFIKTLVNICFLREGPEDLPHSYVLLFMTIIISMFVSVLIGTMVYGLKIAGLSSIAGLLFSFVFTKILLFKKPERFLQTFIAMLGTVTIINIVSIPSIYSLLYFKLSEIGEIFFNSTIFALLVWVVIVYGFIFSKALSSMIGYGIAISVGFVLLNMMIMEFFVAGNTPV